MRAMKRVDGKWITENPDDLSEWLWQNDGLEAVVVDDDTKAYYCATEALRDQFRAAWEKERRKNDRRTAWMFYELALLLHERSKT